MLLFFCVGAPCEVTLHPWRPGGQDQRLSVLLGMLHNSSGDASMQMRHATWTSLDQALPQVHSNG